MYVFVSGFVQANFGAVTYTQWKCI